MKQLLKKIWTKIRNLFKPVDDESVALYLTANDVYMQWIESLERQIEQAKIDLAIGWIDKETYDKKFDEFRKEVKRLSSAYNKELLACTA